MLGGDARPYRHLDRVQFAQGAERHRFRSAQRQRNRADAQRLRHAASIPRRCRTRRSSRSRPSGRGPFARMRRPRRRGGKDHPRRRQGRALAHPGRRRRPSPRRARAADARSKPTIPISSRALPPRSAGGWGEAHPASSRRTPGSITLTSTRNVSSIPARRASVFRAARNDEIHPCTTDFAIMQWMPLEPFTVWVTRRSAARLHSV